MYFSPDIVQDEVGVVYDTYKGKRCVQGVGREACRKATTWKTPDVDGKIILKLNKYDEGRGKEWINLA